MTVQVEVGSPCSDSRRSRRAVALRERRQRLFGSATIGSASRGAFGILMLALGLAGCAGQPEANPAQVEADERRLMSPFELPLLVSCDHLEITVTANFDAEIARPAVSPKEGKFERESLPDGGKVETYTAPTGFPIRPLRTFIGSTQFTAARSLRVTVVGGRSDFRLDVEARGNVNLRAGEHERSSPAGFVVRDGKRVAP